MSEKFKCRRCGNEIVVIFDNPHASDVTLRDYFAGQVLEGEASLEGVDPEPTATAEWCYKVADAMMEVRKK